MILMLVPIVAALIIAIKIKKTFYFSVLVTCLGCAVSMLVLSIAVYAQTGSDILTVVDGYFKDFLYQNEDVTKIYYLSLSSAETGNTLDMQSILNYSDIPIDTAFNYVYKYMGTSVIYSALQFMCGFATLGGLCIFLVFRAIAKKCGADVVKIPSFGRFFLPKYFGRTSLIIIAFASIGYAVGWNNFDYVFNIITALFGCIYFVQGMALIEFLLSKKISSKGGRVAIIAVIVFITLLLFQPFLAILGFIEQGFKNRKHMIEREKEK